MISIELETDMWFEISDTLKRVVENMEHGLKFNLDYQDRAYHEKKYQYLKTISETLEHKLLKD